MLSRIAESMFWMGRHVERADGTARILDLLRIQLMEDASTTESEVCRVMLGAVLGRPDPGPVSLESAISELMVNRDTGSVAEALFAARENARRAREVISLELWEAINTTWHAAQRMRAGAVGERELSWVRNRAALISGVADSTMSHDDAWNFLMLGRSLERADMTARLVAAGSLPQGGPSWSMVLRTNGAQQAFMRFQGGLADDDHAVSFLVLNRSFPRSVVFALRAAERRLDALNPETQPMGISDDARRLLGRVRTSLEYRRQDEVLRDLARHMQQVQVAVNDASQAIAARYFQPGPAPSWTEE